MKPAPKPDVAFKLDAFQPPAAVLVILQKSQHGGGAIRKRGEKKRLSTKVC